MDSGLYSIRMRASKGGSHISGAERIITAGEMADVASELVARALDHARGRADSVTISVDSLAGRQILRLRALPITNRVARSVEDGREMAVGELVSAGVSPLAARAAMEAITGGASPPGGNMRGAMVIDAATGMRLEPDREKGIRARAVDYDAEHLPGILDTLKDLGLEGTRLPEALALATKVAASPGIIAELCISDDPGYLTGYAASPSPGYVRITPLKEKGDTKGGRAFFVDRARFNLDRFVEFMRETPVLVIGPVEFK